MCLAVPGQVLETRGDAALVDLNGNRAEVCITLTPNVSVGQWVLVHAGFAITQMEEASARETWEFLSPSQIAEELQAEEGA